MLLTPKKFADMLRKSTLDREEKRALLQILPSLTIEQIKELALILKNDINLQEKLLQEAHTKREKVLLKMSIELNEIKPGRAGDDN